MSNFSLLNLLCRDRSTQQLRSGVRDMERGKDVDRERMVHHHIQQRERERERDADREAEQAVNKHFAESLKKYSSSQVNMIKIKNG